MRALRITFASSLMRVPVLCFLPRTFVYQDRKSTRLNSSHGYISYAVFCLNKKKPKAHFSQHTCAKHAAIPTWPPENILVQANRVLVGSNSELVLNPMARPVPALGSASASI